MADSTKSWIFVQLLFFLRFVQLGSTVLTGFIAIYFVYWHDIIHSPVPSGLVIVICTSSIAFLEVYLTSAYTLAKHTSQPNINFRLLLKTTTPVALIVAFGFYELMHVPYIQAWCEGDNWFRPGPKGWAYSDGEVEKHMCALTCPIIGCGAVALGFSVFLPCFAFVGLSMEKKGGQIVLEDEVEYEDNLLGGPGLDEKNGDEFDDV